ncbi:tandem-type lipoprotein [Staphylococcus caprae]|uniref:tandem-type lipoprotein n=1 Tax=Staphylococcus caprae TaxID=29380 RepID=UPI001C0FF12A|nr:tandem-type lipoprotein [Staphylococcus caprae]MBU5271523.1 tandem-type lipoprotein [Staphylococcus caprae]
MKSRTKLLITIIVIVVMIIVIAVGFWKIYKYSQNEKIKDSFNESLIKLYPTKNLEEFYDKEGYKDERFNKSDRGKWTLCTDIAIKKEEKNLTSKSMVIHINRNTKQAKGYYYIRKYFRDSKGSQDTKEQKFPVEMIDNKIKPIKKINDRKIRTEIENFRFFVQYGNFKDLNKYKPSKISYNPNVPDYILEYDLNNKEYNVKKMIDKFNFSNNFSSKLTFKSVGDVKGNSLGYKNIELTILDKKGCKISVLDSVEYSPTELNPNK